MHLNGVKMLCVVIKGPTYEEAKEQLERALTIGDLIELSLHHFTHFDLDEIKCLQSKCTLPLLLTFRADKFPREELLALASLHPEYLDMESHAPPSFLEEVHSLSPSTKTILSYHNFTSTPEDLPALYREMQKIPADFYKIALYANSSLEALSLLLWAKDLPKNVIFVSMGPFGTWARIAAHILGSPITFAPLSLDESTAPGQIPARELLEKYHFRSLNRHTSLYGLIGYPVTLSVSDITHNALFHHLKWNGVYLKIPLKGDEVASFFSLLKRYPLFSGLSVTMPLKEVVLPYVDRLSPEAASIGAVNTLLFQKGECFGTNTDSVGALNALEKKGSVEGKTLLLIGAGGAAKAIAYEGKKRGAHIVITNRTREKGEALAKQVGGNYLSMEEAFHKGYDILINATPDPLPLDPAHFLPNTLAMETKTRPKETPFLRSAQAAGALPLYGIEMFFEQAIGQFTLWLGPNDKIGEVFASIEKSLWLSLDL